MDASDAGPGGRREPGAFAAKVVLRRNTHKGSFLLVEGVDELGFFRRRVAKSCEPIDCNGKPNTLETVRRLEQYRFAGAVAAIDDDFDSLESRSAASANIIATDTHDLECLLLRSPALDGVLAEYGGAVEIQAFERQGRTVRQALIDRGLDLGKLRWLAVRRGSMFDFKPIRVMNFIDEKTWQLDRDKLLAQVTERGFPLSGKALDQALAELPAADPWRVCQGHDLVDILVIGLKGVLGGKAHNPGRENVGRLLRQSLDRSDFAATSLHAGLRAWEKSNEPYQVLAA